MRAHPSDAEIADLLRTRAPRVVVVGDVILDRWVRGSVQRLSREAPVPVVEAGDAEEVAGGAANTATNLAAMGARVSLVSVVADDAEGRALLRALERSGVDTGAVVVARGGATAAKTRIVGDGQIIVRVDRPARSFPCDADREHFHASLSAIGQAEAMVVCDYGGGVLDGGAIDRVAALPRHGHLIVDAHDVRRWAAVHADVVTPNASETTALLGAALPAVGRVEAVGAAAGSILDASGARAAVVTLDRDGTVVLEPGGAVARTHARPVPDHQATGAGDTFAAALALGLCAGASLTSAARFAQRAADVVVARPGTAVCTLADLEHDGAGAAAVLDTDELCARIERERERGRRIVFTNGCFDVIHLGHTTHLRQARAQGDVLVVALNDDASVRRLKGPGRPVNPLAERAAVLETLDCVDFVTSFSDDSPVRLLERVRPEIYAKGGDYTPEMLEETAVVRAYGGEVRILDYLPHHSTTDVVNRIVQTAPARS